MSKLRSVIVLLVISLLALGGMSVMAHDMEATPEAAAASSAAPQAVTISASASGVTVPDSVPAGLVTFSIENTTDKPFGPLLARLNEGVTMDAFMAALQKGPMEAVPLVSLLGGVTTQPGAIDKVTYDLKAGDYVLLDFAGEAPTVKSFKVAGEAAKANAPTADVAVSLYDFAFSLPDQITAGEHVWQLQNKGSQWHEMVIIKVDDKMTVAELRELLTKAATAEDPSQLPAQPLFSWSPMSQGETAWLNLKLEPGIYLVACFLPDLMGSGHAHVDLGMNQLITVK
jgi:hypothetical protein